MIYEIIIILKIFKIDKIIFEENINTQEYEYLSKL